MWVKKMNQLKNIKKGIFEENPILFSMLGLCPALAVTTKFENAYLNICAKRPMLTFNPVYIKIDK